jgi:hypothetical protein
MSRTLNKHKTYRSRGGARQAALQRMALLAWLVGGIKEGGDVVVGVDEFLRETGAFALNNLCEC